MAMIVAEENVKPVMEELKDIRMTSRLHSIPFRKTQSTIPYKSVERGYKPETVEAKNTSKTCSICGELSRMGMCLSVVDAASKRTDIW